MDTNQPLLLFLFRKGTISLDFQTLYFSSNISPYTTDSHPEIFLQMVAILPRHMPCHIAGYNAESSIGGAVHTIKSNSAVSETLHSDNSAVSLTLIS
jgi:hypothetical protein